MEQLIQTIDASNTHSFFDWAPIVLSFVSVLVAIYVPWRIANKQNRIAIFDKLFNAYTQLLLVKAFSSSIKDYSFIGVPTEVLRKQSLFCVHFQTSFGYTPDLSSLESCNYSIGIALGTLRKNETQAHMIPLLLPKRWGEKCEKSISNIYEPLLLLTTDVILFDPDKAERTDKLVQEFCAGVDAFFGEYSDKIERLLSSGK